MTLMQLLFFTFPHSEDRSIKICVTYQRTSFWHFNSKTLEFFVQSGLEFPRDNRICVSLATNDGRWQSTIRLLDNSRRNSCLGLKNSVFKIQTSISRDALEFPLNVRVCLLVSIFCQRPSRANQVPMKAYFLSSIAKQHTV